MDSILVGITSNFLTFRLVFTGLDVNGDYGITADTFADIWEKARTVRRGRITILSETEHDRAMLDDIYNRMVES